MQVGSGRKGKLGLPPRTQSEGEILRTSSKSERRSGLKIINIIMARKIFNGGIGQEGRRTGWTQSRDDPQRRRVQEPNRQFQLSVRTA